MVPVAKRTVRTSGSASRYVDAQAQMSIVETLSVIKTLRQRDLG